MFFIIGCICCIFSLSLDILNMYHTKLSDQTNICKVVITFFQSNPLPNTDDMSVLCDDVGIKYYWIKVVILRTTNFRYENNFKISETIKNTSTYFGKTNSYKTPVCYELKSIVSLIMARSLETIR